MESRHVLAAFLVAIALPWAGGEAHAQGPAMAPLALAQERAPAEVKPGDDFFAYANGEWLRPATIPPGKGPWGARNELEERAGQLLASRSREPPAAGGGFHAAYFNEAGIESRGLVPIAPQLKSIDQTRDKAALARWLGKHLRADVDPVNPGGYHSSHLRARRVLRHQWRNELRGLPGARRARPGRPREVPGRCGRDAGGEVPVPRPLARMLQARASTGRPTRRGGAGARNRPRPGRTPPPRRRRWTTTPTTCGGARNSTSRRPE